MRLLAVSMLLILAEAKAGACPSGTSCVAGQTRLAASEAMARSSKERGSRIATDTEGTSAVDRDRDELARPIVHSVTPLGRALEPRAARDPLSHSLRTHIAPTQRGGQMPWVWQALRKSVYSKMPSYQHRGRGADRFSLMVSPVVVDSPTDTVPGVGIEGGF